MADDETNDEDLLDAIERRALFSLPEEEPGEEPDLIDVLRPSAAGEPPTSTPAPDLTLGGYIQRHNRVPAFQGADDQPYTVDVDVDETGAAERPYVAFLVFIRWAATGAGIMDHTESPDIAQGATPEAARQAALELSLYEVKAELDAAIQRRRQALED